MADQIQIAGEDRFPPMIRRGIHRQFSSFSNDEPTNKCLVQCFNDKIHPRECFEKCNK
ncbi:hypothetical protein KKC16_01980 [Patescibacteria group bacterium]|nr:hypothetical protein [Patescibacteria group bacterium]